MSEFKRNELKKRKRISQRNKIYSESLGQMAMPALKRQKTSFEQTALLKADQLSQNKALSDKSSLKNLFENDSAELKERINKTKLILQLAAVESVNSDLNNALLRRVAQPQPDEKAEFENLMKLYIEGQAEQLANNLIGRHKGQQSERIPAETHPELMLQAFLLVAELEPQIVKDNQGIVLSYLLPALNKLKEIPKITKQQLEPAKCLNRALIVLLLDLETTAIPTQLFAFGHSIGCVRDCALSLGTKPTAKLALQDLLVSLGFSESIQHRLSRDPQRFAFSNFLNQLVKYDETSQAALCSIFGKLMIFMDPSHIADRVQKFLRQKIFIQEEFIKRKKPIDLTPDDFVIILDILVQLDRREVKEILERDPQNWLELSKYQLQLKQSARPKILQEENTFQEMVHKDGIREIFNAVQDTCHELEFQCSSFTYSAFQAYIAARIISDNNRITPTLLPTGLGKSFIAAIVAEHYRRRGKRVVIVTSTTFLVNQLKKMLGEARQNLPVLTMKQVLLNKDQFDIFVIDEADLCLMENGMATQENLKSISGFWDLMLKRTILLSATAAENIVDLLFELFGVKREQYLTFEGLIQSSDKQACRAHVEYELARDEKSYWFAVEATIASKSAEMPVIVFVDTIKKVNQIKKICTSKGIQFNSAIDDTQLERVMSVIQHDSQGVVVTLGAYGRGVDIRFKKDSFVLIGYIPHRQDVVTQMTGRSSRTMQVHMSKVIGIDKYLSPASLQDKLETSNRYQMKDGIRVVKVLIGRSLGRHDDNVNFAKALNNEWRIDFKKVSNSLTVDAAIALEKIGSRVRDFPKAIEDLVKLSTAF